jgi:hypothetical protein
MSIDNEIYLPIPFTEGKYFVSNYGNIKNLSGMKLKPFKDSKGYLMVDICKKSIKIHKIVAEVFLNIKTTIKFDLKIDHINNDRTDNRASNLQVLTNRENIIKSIDKSKTSSKYIGVSKCKDSGKWESYITRNNKKINLGRFTDEYQAHLAYKNAVQEIDKCSDGGCGIVIYV